LSDLGERNAQAPQAGLTMTSRQVGNSVSEKEKGLKSSNLLVFSSQNLQFFFHMLTEFQVIQGMYAYLNSELLTYSRRGLLSPHLTTNMFFHFT
jgi:hypothetical protein